MVRKKLKLMKSTVGALMCMLLFTAGAFAQNKTISGTIYELDGEPAIGATVMVKGTGIGTAADMDGKYSLSVPESATTLVVSYSGMATQEVPITGSVINVNLQRDAAANELDEVVAIGYTTVRKKDLVATVTSIGAGAIKDIPVSSAAEAIQGKMAGVNVTATEGSPDAEVQIRVRGGSSLTQSAEPLYIVDGFPVSNINDIPPSDIQSVDVLKDAASTAIYGAQGANGVIIITTKNADNLSEKETNKFNFNVDYSGYWGFKKMAKKYDMLDVQDFVLMQYEYAYLTDKSKINNNFHEAFDPAYAASGLEADKMTVSDILGYWADQPHTDWQDETFRTGTNLNNSLSIKGGNKKFNFTLSYNRIDDKGIMYESDYTRNNLSLKTTFKPIKNLSIGLTARYSNTEVLGAGANTSEDTGSTTESRVRNAVAYSPIKLLKIDAASVDDEEAYGSLYDPITTIDDNYKFKTDNKWTIQGYVQYKFLKNFTLKSDWGYETRDVNTDRFYGTTTYFSRSGGDNPLNGKGYAAGVGTKTESSKFRNTNTLEYKRAFNKAHNLNVLLGEEVVMNDSETASEWTFGYDKQYTGREVFAGDVPYELRFKYSNIAPNDNMLSFFTRADYNYDSRYYASLTMRADASTRFANNDSISNQWGYFPSAALAWRMVDEPWAKDAFEAAKVSDLKWRLSYGVAGNNNVNLGYLYNNVYKGLIVSSIPNEDGEYAWVGNKRDYDTEGNARLKWETTITRNLGLDYGFFNNRLSGTIDMYLNSTKDLIIKKKLPSGKFQYQNVGETENKGIEFSIRGIVLDKRTNSLNYGLSMDANISFNKSKLVSLGAGEQSYPVATSCFSGNYLNKDVEFMLEVGEELGRVWGYVYDGWYTTDDFDGYNASSDTWTKDGKIVQTELDGKGARPGMMKLKDISGSEGEADGVISKTYDRTVIGNTMPLFTGGFSINGNIGGKKWGDIDVAASFTFSYGNDIVNMTKLDLTTINNSSKLRNNLSSVASRYTLFNKEGDYLPGIYGSDYSTLVSVLDDHNANANTYNPVSSYIALSSNAVEDGSFLRLAALTVGYSLPDAWINKAFIKKARFFFSASNLFCLTNYSGADPEVDTRSKKYPLAKGVDFSAYPKTRAFNFGVNLSF